MHYKAFLLFLFITGAGQVQAQWQQVLTDDFSDRQKFIDLSRLVLWYSSEDTLSAFSLREIQDDNQLQLKTLTLKPDAEGAGGYHEGSSYTSTCLDYQIPLYHRAYDTLKIEFDYLSQRLSGNGESGRVGIITIFDYPEGGPDFNDVYELDKAHPFGRPAYNLRLLNNDNISDNGAYLFYGGGKDEMGEFEKIPDQAWLPGFISGPGGFSPGQGESYPEGPVHEQPGKLVSEQVWQHYTWLISPTRLQLLVRQTGDDPDQDQLTIDMYMPDGSSDSEILQLINQFYDTNLDQLPAYFHYFDRIEAVRFFFRSVVNAYLANVAISKTNHFIPPTVSFQDDTVYWQEGQTGGLMLDLINPLNAYIEFDLVNITGSGKIALDSLHFATTDQSINSLNIDILNDQDQEQDTIQLALKNIKGWGQSGQISQLTLILQDKDQVTGLVKAREKLIYPNPFSNYVYFFHSQPRVKVYDLSGKLWLEKHVSGPLFLGDLPSGAYLLEVIHSQKHYKKLMYKL
ncbi:MAG: T9SS type A sorting domain-containing protein [Candidatus Cyclobacteriaceae bacterium M3_2C_046]